MPAYRPRVNVVKPVQKQVWIRPEGTTSEPQDRFDTADRDKLKQATYYSQQTNIQEYTETVTAYNTKCTHDLSHTKNISKRA